MLQPIEVKALPEYRLWLRFSDGVEGEVDLSPFRGRGVFTLWDDPRAFEAVRIGPGRAISWSDEVELCPDSLYLQITGKRPEELFRDLEAISDLDVMSPRA